MITVLAAKEEPAFWETARDWVLGVPLRIAAIILIALVVQVVLTWIIRRAVRRATDRARVERLGQSRRTARTAELSQILLTERTEQRAAAIGSLLRSILAMPHVHQQLRQPPAYTGEQAGNKAEI